MREYKLYTYCVYDTFNEFGEPSDKKKLVCKGSASHVERFLKTKSQASTLAKRGTLIKGRYIVIAKEKEEEEYKPPVKNLEFSDDWIKACKHAKRYLHSEAYRNKLKGMTRDEIRLLIQDL